MTILFVSNFFNHHQAALCDALYQQTGGNFRFLETAALPWEQLALGYPHLKRSYLLSWQENEAVARELLRRADVVLAGEAPPELVRIRVKAGKLLFRYSERPLRNGAQWGKYLPRLLRWHWWNPPGKPIYLLSAGAYTAGDYARFGLFRNRAFQWGYFPEFRENSQLTKDPTRILWCGRLLELKHPELALEAAAALYRQGCRFTLTFLGQGPEEEALKRLARRCGMEHCVSFPGPVSAEQVRQEMERTGIFLFTSDRREGWGVVLNEAMNSRCAVIASHAPGSVPVLLENGKNGIVFPSGDLRALAEALGRLLKDPQEQQRLGAAAYDTIRGLWNPDTAARRLICLSEELLSGGDGQACFSRGPCAPAKNLSERWFP